MLIFDAIAGLAGKITDGIAGYFKGKNELDLARVHIERELILLAKAVDTGQIEINKIEAASTSWFIAGWRPAIGWMGGLALFYEYLIRPIYNAVSYLIDQDSYELPAADLEAIIGIVMAMLGIAGMRTVEKIKGVSR